MFREYLSRRSFLRVECLLAEGLPQQEIALEVGLSPATVADIAERLAKPSRIAEDAEHPLWEEMQVARRCAGCGALVYVWPCLACQMAAVAEGCAPVRRKASRDGLKAKYKRARWTARRWREIDALRRARRRKRRAA